MRRSIFAIIIFVSLSFSGMSQQQTSSMNWLSGSWVLKTGRGTIIETWTQVNDSTLNGKSVLVKSEKDTVTQESLVLSFTNGSWHYISTVTGQNSNQAVTFKVIFNGREEFISENPTHDFPQRIAYRKVGNQLFASIEGKSQGKYIKRNFDYSR